MRKTITGVVMCAATLATIGLSGITNVHADTVSNKEQTKLQMLQATDTNFKQRIIYLKHHTHGNKIQLASLKSQDENIKSQIANIQSELAASSAAASSAAASSAAASSAAASSAAASSAAASSAAASSAAASSAAASSAAASSAASSAEASSAAASSTEASSTEASSTEASSTEASSTEASSTAASSTSNGIVSSSVSSSGTTLNMNQTSGTVNVQAVAEWLANNKGTFSASKWAQIIYRESNGQVNARNASSGAYGILQLLGHGEYSGMTLGSQLQMSLSLPASAWAETNY